MQPHGVAEHAEAVVSRTKHRAKRITTNRVTRSGWFVGGIGALLLSPILVGALVITWILLFGGHGGGK